MKKTIFKIFLSVAALLFVITVMAVALPSKSGGADREPELISPGIYGKIGDERL